MRKFILAAAALTTVSTAAYAAVTFDPATGTGFVGKGDVQILYGWSNKQLQDNAGSLAFGYEASTTNTWTCSWDNPAGKEVVTPRNNESTTTRLFSSIARENSKGKDGSITGFKLTGFDGAGTTTTDGQATKSCPDTKFTYDEGSLQTEDNGGVVTVNGTPLS